MDRVQRTSDALVSQQDTFYTRVGKRLFDLCVAVPLLLVTLPVQAVVGVLVRQKLGRPVVFRQQRPGRNAEPFELVKFRTMTDATDSAGELLPDSGRLTRFGQLLRATSLDELPELVNVIRGEMSLVGPRPLRMHYLPRYSARQSQRHAVRPGMTGLAQVSGRNNLDWDERFELDVRYVESVSFGLDLGILVRTVSSVIRRDDVSTEGHATAPEFLGSASNLLRVPSPVPGSVTHLSSQQLHVPLG